MSEGELNEKSSRGERRTSRRVPAPASSPLPRVGRERAEEATLRAELDASRRKSDLERERTAAMTLARLLARRDRQRDEAASLALRAIRIRDDAELRREVAEWLESLGEPALAAAVLGPLATHTEGAAGVTILARVAMLYARAGDAEGAIDVLEEASALDGTAALPLELRGTLSGWAPKTLSPGEAADAFTRAAERRAATGSDPFEDLLRAFETDPTSDVAANALAEALAGRGKRLAADEVRREHGRALKSVDPARAAQVHRRRREEAIEQGATARALGAALDEGFGPGGLDADPEFVELLARTGLKGAFPDVAALGDPDAIAAASEHAPTNVRPVLLSFAAELLLDRGDRGRARALAQKACDIEPNYPRSAASLAAAVLEDRDAGAATAIERAIRLVCARGMFCRALSLIHEALGALAVSVAWAQHTVALRPGDTEALERWFQCATDARDAARLGDAIAWAVAQPQPATMLAELVARGLRNLIDLDIDRAAVLARRALDAFGPHRMALRESVELVAERARDEALGATLLERFVSAGAKADDRPGLLLRLANLRSRLGDGDGEAIAIARALREGLDPKALDDRALVLRERVRTSDGFLAALEVEARVAQVSGDAVRAWEALRHWGAGLVELAGDLRSAATAWTIAAKLVPERGARIVADDLRQAGGHEGALAGILGVLETETDPKIVGILAEEGSRAALSVSQPGRALALAKMALDKMPDHTDALEMAELGAAMDGRPADMSPIYETVARRALGKFGRRSAHFRAARYFERQELYFLALRHATEAFAAVPTESALALLRRISERSGDRGAVVRAVVNVAEASRSKEHRSAWLLRAAELAGDDEEGSRQRVDILLRGAVASPDRSTLQRLGKAIQRLLELAPVERDTISLRVGNAARMLTARVEGPDGARIAIELSRLAIGAFGDSEGGAHALEKAIGAAGDLEEYVELMPYVDAFARVGGKLLPSSIALVTKPYANVAAPALRLLHAIAEKAGTEEQVRDLSALLAKYGTETAPNESLDFSMVGSTREPTFEEGAAPALEPLDPAAAPGPEPEPKPINAAAAEPSPEPAPAATLAVQPSPPVEPDIVAAPVSSRRLQLVIDAEPKLEREPPQPDKPVEEKRHDLEQLALEAARDPSLSAPARAQRLTAVAAARETRGDLEGASEALVEAAHLDPSNVDRWRAAWTVAQEANRNDHVLAALQRLETFVEGTERPRVLRHLARTLQELGRAEEAFDAWQRLLALVPDDGEADQSAEVIVTEARDYERLATHLADRVQRLSRDPERRDSMRAAQLRRAAILEQRLERVGEACAELEALLREAPDNESALRYLVDLYERQGEFDRAAALLRRLAELARGPQTRNDLGLRAAFALRDAGDLRSALGLVKMLLDRDPDLDGMALHVEIARALEDDAELGVALERAAASGRHDPTIAAEMWVEAAQAAARGGDANVALIRSRRASVVDPSSAEAQLFARGLEYRERGAGDVEAAERTLSELEKIKGTLAPEDQALNAFLKSEALVALGRGSDAQEVLTQSLETVGAHSLLSLGLAERLAAAGSVGGALAMFETALSGELFGFRSRGAVALTAARLASDANRDARAFLAIAAECEDTRAEARRLLSPSEPVPSTPSSETPQDEPEAAPAGQSLAAASAGPVGLERLIEPPSQRSSSIPPSMRITDLAKAVAAASTPEGREQASLALAHAHLDLGSTTAAQTVLSDALAMGSTLAGDELAAIVQRGERSSELVRVRVRLAALAPGDASRLEDLRAATMEDKNTVHARAVEHLIRAFDPNAGPLPPPPLVVQREQPGILSVVSRGPWSPPLAEAFALLHEHAHGLFARELSTYSLSGLEHVIPGPTSALSRLLEVALRLLGAPSMRLYAKRTTAAPRGQALLLDAPAALIAGDVREETVGLRYALGQAIGAAQPENLLLGGLEDNDARALFEALVGAFGPSDRSSQLSPASGRYAGALWERLPPRAQRRLQELLAAAALAGPIPAYETLRDVVRQSTRRVGLLLAGNVSVVVRAVAAERGLDAEATTREGGLTELSREPAIADLLRLAASPVYADARWQPLTAGARSRPSGSFPVVS